MKTQIIPWWCSPHPGLNHYLPLAHSPAECYCDAPKHLALLIPLPFTSAFFSIPLSPSFPNARSYQAVSGARCGGEIAACMYTHRRMSTHRQNTWCLCKLDYKGCVTFAAHRHNTHTLWRSSTSGSLRSASLGCLTKAKLWLSRLLRPGYPSATHRVRQGAHVHDECKQIQEYTPCKHKHVQSMNTNLKGTRRDVSRFHSSWFVHTN